MLLLSRLIHLRLHRWSHWACALLHRSHRWCCLANRWGQSYSRLLFVFDEILKRVTATRLNICKAFLNALLCCSWNVTLARLFCFLCLAQKILERITATRLNVGEPFLGLLDSRRGFLLWRSQSFAPLCLLLKEILKRIATPCGGGFGSSL